MKRAIFLLIILFFFCLYIFEGIQSSPSQFPNLRGSKNLEGFSLSGLVYAQESSPSSKLQVDISFSELPYVRISPNSPAFFLKFLWERVQMLVTRESRQKAFLAIEFAGKRLAEALKVAADEENIKTLEELFQKRIALLEKAYLLSEGDEEVRGELIKQVLLGEKFLEESKDSAETEGEKRKIQDLMEKRASWLKNLEAGLGEDAEGLLDAEKMRVFESTMAADVKGEFFENQDWAERLQRIIFGVKTKILSPYPAPKRK